MIDSTLPAGTPLDQLIFLIGKGSIVTRVSDSTLTSNGLHYCFVEIEEPQGSYYVFHAYGHEARELHLRATELIGKQKNSTSFVGTSNTNNRF